jgi:toxin FitB
VTVAVDTSVAVPLVVRSHQHHAEVVRWWAGQELALSGHALAETYSVLTRLRGDARLSAADAARLLDARFATPLTLSGPSARTVHATLSLLGPEARGGARPSRSAPGTEGQRSNRRLIELAIAW